MVDTRKHHQRHYAADQKDCDDEQGHERCLSDLERLPFSRLLLNCLSLLDSEEKVFDRRPPFRSNGFSRSWELVAYRGAISSHGRNYTELTLLRTAAVLLAFSTAKWSDDIGSVVYSRCLTS